MLSSDNAIEKPIWLNLENIEKHTCNLDISILIPIWWSSRKCRRACLPSVLSVDLYSHNSKHEESVDFSLLPWGRLGFLSSGSPKDRVTKNLKVLTLKGGIYTLPCGLKWLEPKLGLCHLI